MSEGWIWFWKYKCTVSDFKPGLELCVINIFMTV